MTSPQRDTYAIEALEIELLLTAIDRCYGYDFSGYAPASLRRRIRRMLSRENLQTVSMLQDRVLRDPAVLSRFVSTISVHVTTMFRDPSFYQALRNQVVPLLRTWPFTRAWVAGCATGEEAYSLAILLHEEGLYERCRIYATDVSDQLVRKARQGIFPAVALESFENNYRRAGGTQDFGQYCQLKGAEGRITDTLREHIIFGHHNLVSDGSFNEFHLILCRNVMIYFEQPLKDRVHGLLFDSLARSGVLGLGPTEQLDYTPHVAAYEALVPAERLYRRVG